MRHLKIEAVYNKLAERCTENNFKTIQDEIKNIDSTEGWTKSIYLSIYLVYS